MKITTLTMGVAAAALLAINAQAQPIQNFSGSSWIKDGNDKLGNLTINTSITNLIQAQLPDDYWSGTSSSDRPRQEIYRPNTILVNHVYKIIFTASLKRYSTTSGNHGGFGGCFFQLFPAGTSSAFGAHANFLLQCERDIDSDSSPVGTFSCYDNAVVSGVANGGGSYQVISNNINGNNYTFMVQIKCMNNQYGYIHTYVSEGANTSHWTSMGDCTGANTETANGVTIKCGSYSEGVGTDLENPSDHQDFNNQTVTVSDMTIQDVTDINHPFYIK